MKDTVEVFIYKSRLIHGDKYCYSNVIYTSSTSKVEITCNEHGNFLQIPSSHVKGIGCPKCGNIKKGVSKTMTLDKFIEKCKKIHNNKYTYETSKYTGVYDTIEITCPKHGYFQQVAHNHIQGRGCIKCSSSFSKPCKKWLNSLDLDLEIEYWLPFSRIRVDGFDKNTNTVYEFHGTFWHAHPNHKNFKENEMHPGIRNKTWGQVYKQSMERELKIKEMGYNLVVMWEHDQR